MARMNGSHYENCLEVDRKREKRFYRICKELELHGESIIENGTTDEWNGTLRKLGIKAKPLIEEKLMEPIWKTTNKKNSEKRLIRIPKDVEVKEVIRNKKSYFPFRRRKIC